MNKNFIFYAVVACGLFVGCKASVEPVKDAVVDTMEIPNLPFAGQVNGDYRSFREGMAFPSSQGNLSIALVNDSRDLNCESRIPNAAHFNAIVPAQTGTYYSGTDVSTVQYPLNYSFRDQAGIYQNIASEKSKIIISEVTATEVNGGAYSFKGVAPFAHDVSGKFTLINCAAIENQKLRVKQQNSTAFENVYSEIVPIQINGQWQYVFRAMDKVPSKKCNKWEAWMQSETPVKYIQTKVPMVAGDFNIQAGDLELGFLASTGGPSYRGFLGQGRIVSVDRFTSVLTLNTKDAMSGTGYEIIGRITTNICDK